MLNFSDHFLWPALNRRCLLLALEFVLCRRSKTLLGNTSHHGARTKRDEGRENPFDTGFRVAVFLNAMRFSTAFTQNHQPEGCVSETRMKMCMSAARDYVRKIERCMVPTSVCKDFRHASADFGCEHKLEQT